MRKLSTIKENVFVFIDTNIFLYDFTGVSKECREFLKLIESGYLRGITSFNVLQELDHKLIREELHQKYGQDISKTKEKKLLKNKQSIQNLTMYKNAVDVVLNLGIPALSCSTNDFKRALKYQSEYGLLSVDAINLALIKEFEIENIATNDKDFEKIPWLNVFMPGDI